MFSWRVWASSTSRLSFALAGETVAGVPCPPRPQPTRPTTRSRRANRPGEISRPGPAPRESMARTPRKLPCSAEGNSAMIGLTSQSTICRLACAVNQIYQPRFAVRTKSPLQADKILCAAARLFASHRFHEARMEDIAALAEVGKGTLYRYFKDKEELYLALLDRAAESLQSRLCRCLDQTLPPRRQLVAVVAGLLAYFDEEPHVPALILHAEALQRPDTEFPWQKTRQKTMALVKGLFEAGQRQGVFAVADPDLATLMLLGGLRAVIRFGKHPCKYTLADEIVTRFLDGFGQAESRPGRRGSGAPLALPAPIASGQIVDAASSPLHNA